MILYSWLFYIRISNFKQIITMKKILLFTMVFVGAYSFANAQVSGGIKGGLNFANVNTDGDPDGKTGYHVGAFLNIGLGGISLQPEFLYSVKGAEDFDLTYIEIPILLKKNFAKVINIHLGPQFGILTKAEMDLGFGSEDVKSNFKGSDISVVFGGGVDLPMGLSAGIRYIIGLSDINDDFDFDLGFSATPNVAEVKNKTFQVYLGYKLFGK
jgi:hypothetical protein